MMPPESGSIRRLRRLRRTPALRALVRESRPLRDALILPLFLVAGRGVEQPIAALPGHAQRSVDRLESELEAITALGIPAVLLFGVPDQKDPRGSAAWSEGGVVQEAIRTVKRLTPQLLVMTDICLCSYTSHGHCGVLVDGAVDNDATLELLASTAVSHARAGADVVAPSAMMDGQVGALRQALDRAGHADTVIMSYAAKFASSFYGPFREAADAAPAFGDRSGYQMDPANAAEALREVETDLREGADIVMVKPALPYLDVLYRVKQRFAVPVAAYNVSGEYAMVEAAAQRGWIDGTRAALEVLGALVRAGADLIITYHAKQLAPLLAGTPHQARAAHRAPAAVRE
jgi:porphobilinogen synthase